MPPYLTKSRFKIGCECPTKLYYAANRDRYHDTTTEDTFLQGLADGGYQVGELARWMLCDHPLTDTVAIRAHEAALAETNRRLAHDHATVAEAAFRHEDLFVRADVVVKNGSRLDLYEVKSKSRSSEDDFWHKRDPRKLNTAWKSYLFDVAFQKHVIQKARPDLSVRAFLVLLDKEKCASVDGLNRVFRVFRADGQSTVQSTIRSRDELGDDVLIYCPVDADIAKVRAMAHPLPDGKDGSFEQLIAALAEICTSGKQVFCAVGAKCKKCQYRLPAGAADGVVSENAVKLDGREECWKAAAAAAGKAYVPAKPKVFEVWNFRGTDAAIETGKFFLEELSRADIGNEKRSARQWTQVEKVKQEDQEPWIDRTALAAEMRQWRFPLHFIDFETSRLALPAKGGMVPYTQVAFQFSHHTVDRDGLVRHAGEWIETRAGEFPSFAFVRELKRQLDKDDGTIFRYSHHENTVLRDILRQLEDSEESDRDKLIAWIASITQYKTGTEKKAQLIEGNRNMVDMWRVVVDHHYDPATHGSNSLKAVLPAIIGSSDCLRTRYGRPISQIGLQSLNFTGDWVWVRPDCGNDPYKALPPIFENRADLEALSAYVETLEEIDDGGAATIAYAKLQFFELPEAERAAIRSALLRYCELDTLAMVMLYEYWKEITA